MTNKLRRTFMISAITALPALVSLPFAARALSLPRMQGSDGGALAAYVDGKRDATQVIQALVDSQPSSGGAVVIPAGRYLINVEKGLVLRSGIHLKLLPGASLIAIPTKLGQSSIIKIYRAHDVSIHGGLLIGERDGHLGSGGEWGFGVDVRASSMVTLSDMVISKCWGDGFYLGSLQTDGVSKGCSNVVLRNVTAVGNRRQGLSIVACDGAHILDSKFLSTHGTPPAAGIDLEPDAGDKVSNITIHNCDVLDNAGPGIQTWNAASHVEISDCRVNRNRSRGIFLGGVVAGIAVHGNHVSDNGDCDIFIGKDVRSLKLMGNIVTPPSLLSKLKKSRIFHEVNH